jgi:NAD(P)-dependent dehydrogenase (short-subunit alcohol dehydrogenase family)
MTVSINLTNRRALVTGVSSGIGAGIALALAQAGADVAGCALEPLDAPGPRAFVDQAAALGRRAVYTQADVTHADSARSSVDWAAGELGGLDYVISNAGRNIFAGAEGCDEATWQANIDLNLAAHWRVAQAARPYLLHSEQPVIIVIASNHAWRTTPGAFPYNVAKAGMTALVQSLTLEWGPQIRTVGVAPGFINTPLADGWFAMFPDPAAKRASIETIHPVGRLGTPADIGAFCAFLCSPLAGYIAGTTLLIDGGRSAVMQDI